MSEPRDSMILLIDHQQHTSAKSFRDTAIATDRDCFAVGVLDVYDDPTAITLTFETERPGCCRIGELLKSDGVVSVSDVCFREHDTLVSSRGVLSDNVGLQRWRAGPRDFLAVRSSS